MVVRMTDADVSWDDEDQELLDEATLEEIELAKREESLDWEYDKA